MTRDPIVSARLGTLEERPHGRFALRFERHLPRRPEVAWRALTDPDLLGEWFPAVVDWELTLGATLRFRPTAEQRRRYGLTDADTTTGRITQVEVPHLLEYTWGDEVLRWELHPEGDQGTRLVFTNTFGDRDTAVPAAAGWHAGLDVLQAQVEGRAVDWSPFDAAERLGPGYADHLG